MVDIAGVTETTTLSAGATEHIFTDLKLPAGDAVMYPSSSLHHVARVTRGQRIVALTWIQSQVRDPARREILFDLATTRDQLHEQESGSDLHQRVDRSYANLLRMWAEV
ncbi:MAG: hypothetical protein P8Z31_06855 [Gammaproteobacteria bacterium]